MTRPVKYTNNAASKVVNGISGVGALSNLSLTPGTGALFPEILVGSTDYFYATLSDANGNIEVIRVTRRSGDSFSVSDASYRGLDGTIARTWPADTDFQIRISKSLLDDITRPVDVQHFVTVGTSTWTKPAGAQMIFVQIWQPGAGGGSGRRRAIASQSTAASGGGGGSGGAYVEHWILATAVPATVSVVVGAGGNGGAAQTSDDTNGNAGASISTYSKFYNFPGIAAAGAGPGGSTSDTQRALPAEFNFAYPTSGVYGVRDGRGGAGAAGSASQATSGLFGGGGGGGGGGYAANGTSTGSGGQGAIGGAIYSSIGGINTAGFSGGNGDRQFVAPNIPQPELYDRLGGGGGGGATAFAFTSGAASSSQNGGNGGWPGGGGGGGSASQGANSGAGGNGGDGYVRVTTFF